MTRLCERPGCSDPAAVAYGMRPAQLVFWLDALRPEHDEAGVLCRRHADTMIVPLGWTLDDHRQPDLHLFRPPTVETAPSPRARRARRTGDDTEQLRLGVEVPAEPAADAVDLAWSPVFDPDDDLDGLLAASSPLLARAFRSGVRGRAG
jgi:hypothetical protein